MKLGSRDRGFLLKINGKLSAAVLNLCHLNRSTIGVAHTPL